jgi:hypothetical protein
MVEVKAHFDGHHLVPDEPVSLPKDKQLVVHVEVVDAPARHRKLGLHRGEGMIADDFDAPLPDAFWLGDE